jgi:hypothetical protein
MVATQVPPKQSPPTQNRAPIPRQPDWAWYGGPPVAGPGGPYATGPVGPPPRQPTLREWNAYRVGQTARRATEESLRTHQRHVYFRESGIAAAARHTMGMDPVPSHAIDYLNGLLYQQGPSWLYERPRTLEDLLGPQAPRYRSDIRPGAQPPGRGSRARTYAY